MNARNALIVAAIAVVAFAGGFAGARASGGDKAPQNSSAAAEAGLPAAGDPASGVRVAQLGQAATLPALKAKPRRKTRSSRSDGGRSNGNGARESQERTNPDTGASPTPAPAKPQPTAAPPQPKPKPTAAPPPDDSGGGD